MVHNVTAATRLLDVLDLVARDSRIQVDFSVPQSSAFTTGTERFLLDRGMTPVPWAAARAAPFDLAISASHGGDLHRLAPPLIILPHGMGYNKYLGRESGNPGIRESGNPGIRESGNPGIRESGNPGIRESGNPGIRESGNPVFGLSPEWLVVDGKLVPSSLVLSHPEQLARLARSCPEAAEVAVVAGDPCFDRIVASGPLRAVYRRALGVTEGQRLVVVSSTWGPPSLYGAHPDLVARLAAESCLDEWRVVVALHPNVWHWHSPWAVRRWAEGCRRAGVTLLPPEEGWRAALVAADVVLGDHGSVTFYGAALGTPTILATAPRDTVAPDSAVGRLLDAVPCLDHGRPLTEQLDEVVKTHDPAREPFASVVALTTSAPGQAMPLLRAEFYRLLKLAEPDSPAEVRTVPVPAEPPVEPGAHLVRVDLLGGLDAAARVTRRPAELLRLTGSLPEGTHLSVDADEPYRRFLDLAEIVVAPDGRDAAEVLAALPGALLATGPVAGGDWLVVGAGDRTLRFTGAGDAGRVCASFVHAWLTDNRSVDTIPTEVSLTLGTRVLTVTVSGQDSARG
ncbi:hypothetical protein [Actinokineospora iranica]|uniref:hypothetical protein n=1 Tax=Actinokineospora iranica TaxID=1271860 RepID=UPI00111466EE|nr:hypothetical protein [Actinokineospora iranica]